MIKSRKDFHNPSKPYIPTIPYKRIFATDQKIGQTYSAGNPREQHLRVAESRCREEDLKAS